MSLLQSVVLFLAIISITIALNCYTGATANKDKPRNSQDCPLSRLCMKKSVKADKDTLNYYDCAISECSTEGCVANANQITTCCCTKDLCNSSPQLTSLLSLVPIALVKLLL